MWKAWAIDLDYLVFRNDHSLRNIDYLENLRNTQSGTMSKKDYYKILGVNEKATSDEIKSAYRKLAKEWHPDLNPNRREEAEQKFKEINEAHETLIDPNKRAIFDRSASGFTDFNFDWGNHWHATNTYVDTKQPRDVTGAIEVSLEEVALGSKRTFSITHEVDCTACSGTGSTSNKVKTCTKCSGSGQVQQARQVGFFTVAQLTVCPSCSGRGSIPDDPCVACKGTGEQTKDQTISIDIPVGVSHRDQLRAIGMGRHGGDLKIVVIVRSHPKFERYGNDLKCSVEIPFLTALKGGKHSITGLTGSPIELDIPRSVPFNEEVLAKGKGIAGGNLLVKIQFKLPKLNDEALTKIEEIIHAQK